MFKVQLFAILILLTVQVSFAQNCKDFSNYPDGEHEGKKQHVLYRNLMDKEQYETAFPKWKKLYKYSPAGNAYHFIDGITLYKYHLENGRSEAEIDTYIENIVRIYEHRLACKVYDEKGIVLESMAIDLYDIGYNDDQKLFDIFQEALDMNGNKTDYFLLLYFAEHITYMFSNELLDKETTRKTYFQLKKIIKSNSNNQDYQDAGKSIEKTFEPYKTYFLTCEDWIEELKPKYLADAENPEIFRSVLMQLFENGCKRGNPFMEELIKKDSIYASNFQEVDCTLRVHSCCQFGIQLYAKGDLENATFYLKKP